MAKKTQTVDEYIADRDESVREILVSLRQLLKATLPKVVEGMKWGAPVYCESGGEPLVYLYGGKDHANLGLLRGAELDDPGELLEGSGKSTRIIKLFPGDEIPKKALRRLLRQGAKLEENAPGCRLPRNATSSPR